MSRKILDAINAIPQAKCRKRRATAGRKGMADITGIIQGRAIEIEVKTESYEPTKLQLKWLRDCKAAGAAAGVARSVEDAMAILKNNNIKIGEK